MESDRVNKDARKVDLQDTDNLKMIQRRFLEEFPVHQDCTIIVIDCMNMGDPHHDPRLRSHKGTHPETMKSVAREMDENELRRFTAAFRQWVTNADGSDLLIISICRRARHRSIANRELLYVHLNEYKDKYKIQVEQGPKPTFSKKICPAGCPACCHDARFIKGELLEMLQEANAEFKEKFENAYESARW
eukprot:12424660-Karenia_brevis.AAC.1